MSQQYFQVVEYTTYGQDMRKMKKQMSFQLKIKNMRSGILNQWT